MWTEAQSRVIEARNNNLLVSAAAGSGKTAVLVERIISMIVADGINIEQLIVVTFTRAAAAEMKERIRAALEAKLEADPDNQRLAEQMTLVSTAMITTIDSFCLSLIRENFLEAGVDPAFRNAENGEIELLENELLQDIIEKHYADGDEAFVHFANCLSPGRSDARIEDLIMRIYRYSKSYPWPKEWLASLNEMYAPEGDSEFEQLKVVNNYTSYLRDIFRDYQIKYAYLMEVCKEPNGPCGYLPVLEEEYGAIGDVLEAVDFGQLVKRIKAMEFGRLGVSKGAAEELKELVKATRNKFKSTIKKIMDKVIGTGVDAIIGEVRNCRDNVAVLTRLAAELYDAVAVKKRERNVIDFNDMEHIALDLLVKREDGTVRYTPTADRLAGEYAYIMVDEYQDSNYLQEYILQAVSSERFGRPNLFMVGDVKQSIYGFRQAVPELFVNKYHGFEKGTAEGEKIELQVNFRSRKSVLDAANQIFFAVMRECVGRIEYTEAVKLNSGAEFKEPLQPFVAGGPCEIILAGTKNEAGSCCTKAEAEAAAVISKIKEYTDADSCYVVWDKSTQSYRKPEWRDITVLLRNDSGWFESFADMFMNAGIPVSVETKGGYFNTAECRLVLDMLACVDNPYQDIPLAGVMVSYFGRFTFEELARIRRGKKTSYLYDNLLAVEETAEEYPKVKEFTDWLDELRREAGEVNLYDLLWTIIHQSGYYGYAGSMPAGEKRQSNLDALLLKARNYESSQIKGLFNFLRYIELIGKYNVEYGENASGSDENAVKLMSIHKSKGLEFPIVFVCGITREFNMRDTTALVVVDRDLGIGMYSFHLDSRTKKSSFYREAIAKKLHLSDIAEEIRVLYVALTRAKEKLVLVGSTEDVQGTLAKCETFARQLKNQDNRYMLADIEGCNNYLKMILPVALNAAASGAFAITPVNADKVAEWVEKYTKHTMEVFAQAQEQQEHGRTVKPYPYERYLTVRSKMSVSEIKKMSYAADEEDFEKPAKLLEIPEFAGDGAARGTAYHRVMECLDYGRLDQSGDVSDGIAAQLEDMVAQGKLTAEEAGCVNVADIAGFVTSELGNRVGKAYAVGRLKREQPFVLGIPAKDLVCYKDLADCDETVLIQGVIDLYFIEEKEITLVDYKTDRISPENGKEILTSRYAKQLEIYGEALERLIGSGFCVKERIIYSFALGTYFQV